MGHVFLPLIAGKSGSAVAAANEMFIRELAPARTQQESFIPLARWLSFSLDFQTLCRRTRHGRA
jgi:hypothetical protein